MALKLLLLSFFTSYFFCGNAQTKDTVYYPDKTVLLITTEVNDLDSVLQMYDQSGKNILTNGVIFHSFYDAKFGKKRCIKVAEKIFIVDYCVSEADTIYNYIQFDEAFKSTLKRFYEYLEKQVVYPKNALKKGVQATVKVSLIIESNGSITNVYPLTKHEWGFEENLISTIKAKKQFGFVMHRKRPVKLYLEFPFAFKISNKK